MVIFTIRDGSLAVLLRRSGLAGSVSATPAWSLPSGCVSAEDSLAASAERILAEQAGMAGAYMEQLGTFGGSSGSRTPSISVAYLALVPADHDPQASPPGGTIQWWWIDRLPALHPGHRETLAAARDRLSAKLDYSTIAFQLMPGMFTLSELQQVYEIVQDRRVDKRNFRKRMQALAHIEPTERRRRNGSHRPARLYRFTARDAVQYLK